VGAALHKKGGDAMPLAKRTFEHAVPTLNPVP
jgi:hypothetical protein